MNLKQYFIPREKAPDVLADAISLANRIFTDQIDCSVSIYRLTTNLTILEILEKGLNEKYTLFHFIERDALGRNYFDVGLSTSGEQPHYFLWIEVLPKQAQILIEKYNLKQR